MQISEEVVKRWQLTNCHALSLRGGRGVYAAESAQFGPVILKADSNIEALLREYRALSGMKAGCKVCGWDESAGILIEERVLPGTRLREEASPERRVEALCKVFSAIHRTEAKGRTYLNWLEDACKISPIPAILEGKGEKALTICRELFEKYPERVLLHGDLHHDNILRRADGGYAVIDPKGIIGPEILDLPRFLLNEPQETVREMLALVQARFGYPMEDLRKAYYMEAVLANLWLAEDGESVREPLIRLVEEILEEV